MSKRLLVLISILVAVSVLLGTRGSPAKANPKPIPVPVPTTQVKGSMIVPAYSTNEGILLKIGNILYPNEKVEFLSPGIVGEDKHILGVFISQAAGAALPGLLKNYGQTCEFNNRLTYSTEYKIVQPTYRVSTEDEPFILWCSSMIPEKIDVVVVTEKLINGTYTIEYYKDQWNVLALFIN